MANGVSVSLTVEEMQLIEARVANDKRSVGLAYVLWFFLGLWGIHNFYLGKTKLALFQLLGGAAALLILITASSSKSGGLGFIGILVLIVWVLSFLGDLFFFPGRVKQYSDALRAKISLEITSRLSR